MPEIFKSSTFNLWFSGLRDRRSKAQIAVRIDRLAAGNAGDVKPIGGGLSEMRINIGPGYRVYYMQQGSRVIILLAGGDKSTQSKDIDQAKFVADQWKREAMDK